ncbi:hypothetical protein LEP1GSC016_1336 [Leptospira borgpetersenii serovar Hardjo-bovis str. Sponselee]|uniref:Uncharacterized protein n=1 Tax=Leptospira borgpetersenii serovar Hardjo-bovis str. Sponselee TaxID=1303729 RepID=M6BSC9_LEPBO|nr:hypothetical protein LBK6_05205 [Leptospira borgpetersenii serovar Hardjo]AWV71594.1 hypothetical protein B9T54_05670 [Leptospira borgpetersenii serovar Hardjo-bovis]EMJ82657.1 hypothetical protein LEP1GSC016_1336 [Leptospira borgpetersenii serovar Hardjo-bovis str. Sponselee]TQE51158.1 hypothetical protein FFZ95_15425 [Leptospira borgpetersenii]AMX61002.1 hypothetical protein LBK9_05140 [Leptospira borgpetersenii serovar Hardjo]
MKRPESLNKSTYIKICEVREPVSKVISNLDLNVCGSELGDVDLICVYFDDRCIYGLFMIGLIG